MTATTCTTQQQGWDRAIRMTSRGGRNALNVTQHSDSICNYNLETFNSSCIFPICSTIWWEHLLKCLWVLLTFLCQSSQSSQMTLMFMGPPVALPLIPADQCNLLPYLLTTQLQGIWSLGLEVTWHWTGRRCRLLMAFHPPLTHS